MLSVKLVVLNNKCVKRIFCHRQKAIILLFLVCLLIGLKIQYTQIYMIFFKKLSVKKCFSSIFSSKSSIILTNVNYELIKKGLEFNQGLFFSFMDQLLFFLFFYESFVILFT